MRLLHVYQNLPPFRHPTEHCMYDTMPREVYLPHMVNDVYKTVNASRKCIQDRGNKTRTRHPKLFQASVLLPFIVMDILRPLPKTKNGNQ